jgi:hypothetical protein
MVIDNRTNGKNYKGLKMKVFLMLVMVLCMAGLVGCGASTAQVNAISLDATTYVNETLQVYETAAPADAAQAATNSEALINSIIVAEVAAQSMPTSDQIAEDGAALIQILQELLQIIPQVMPLFGEKHAGVALTQKQQDVLAKYYDLKVRLAVVQSHRNK